MDKKLILSELINHFSNGNISKFANLLGVRSQVVSNWKKRGVLDHELILEKLPEVSAEWLMRGVGPMLKEAAQAPEQEPEQSISELQLNVMESMHQELTEIKILLYRLKEEQKQRSEDNSGSSMCG